ncbi:MAG: DNA repair protein RecN [Gammaproteobacteria bacterium RIFCSPLOWO2_02_FULL_61_13]|nr:MAG: DNA repair protein RecN [Gammaproteobacteria bacterium RIFCSPLOWO2_02_FULL_61_13]
MLRHLHLRNFAVVEELELEFGPGLTVFTGETGAGKSILIEALGFLLGDRADATLIRAGAERMEASATFASQDVPELLPLLAHQELESGAGELLIRRVIGQDGRSKAFINGSPVALQFLREVGELFVDIHGQHAHQSLQKSAAQRDLVDDFGGHEKELAAVRDAWRRWSDAARQLADLNGGGKDREAELALLRYQVDELRDLKPEPGEAERLEAEYRRLANSARLQEVLQTVLASLYETEHSSYTRLGNATRDIADLQRFDPSLAGLRELLDTAAIQISEAVDGLRQYLDRLELDPGQLRAVEQRLDELHDAARKHRIPVTELHTQREQLEQRLAALEQGEESVALLTARRDAALKDYALAAGILHTHRNSAAAALTGKVQKQIRELGMPGAEFRIEVTNDAGGAPAPRGGDDVQLLVSANPGQPPRPLSKVASGGELSRISLGIQVSGSGERGIATLIFDEVDAGIGGGVAELVGRLLRRLARGRQVLCVTHLPQVACQGEHHFQVEKSTVRRNTRTEVRLLDKKGRVEEIARMLGGLKISEQTRAHAREMLENQVTSNKT